MGKCKYCGASAGFLRSVHPECEERRKNGMKALKGIVDQCFDRKEDFYLHAAQIKQLCADSHISDAECRDIYRDRFDWAIERYLDDGLIDQPEERTVARFMQFTGMSQQELNQRRSLEKVVQSKVLQELMNGQIPTQRFTVAGNFPFMLAKNENLIWLFRNVTLHMQKVRRETVGRTRGVSVRVCRGVYYRTGGFRGTPVETTYMQRVAMGTACITDRHLYFHSPEKSLRIPLGKILSLDTYSNGLGVQKDGANDKPMFFENMDSWFCYNVITNLNND